MERSTHDTLEKASMDITTITTITSYILPSLRLILHLRHLKPCNPHHILICQTSMCGPHTPSHVSRHQQCHLGAEKLTGKPQAFWCAQARPGRRRHEFYGLAAAWSSMRRAEKTQGPGPGISPLSSLIEFVPCRDCGNRSEF